MTKHDKMKRAVRRGWALVTLAVVGLVAVYVRAALFTPIEINQGPAQKILYVHVPSAWAALMMFTLVGVLSLVYLWKRDRKFDTLAVAAVEVGLVFGTIMLTTGPIWGQAAWGEPWAWDVKLTSTAFLYLLFVGYLVLRGEIIDVDIRARFSAVIGVLAIILVPFIFLSMYMFRGQHPDPPVLRAGGPSMPTSMLATLILSVLVFTVLCLGFLQLRYALGTLNDLREGDHGIS